MFRCLFEHIGKITYELSSNKLNTNIDMNDILREKVDWYTMYLSLLCVYFL